jgi:hypothetical protein
VDIPTFTEILPPASNANYTFNVVDNERACPRSSKFLVERFHSRKQGTNSREFEFIPQRRGRIPNAGTHGPEWGLHFVEGLSFLGILIVVAVGIIATLVTGVVVAVVYKDGGVAAGWAGCVAAVVGLVVSTVAIVSKA